MKAIYPCLLALVLATAPSLAAKPPASKSSEEQAKALFIEGSRAAEAGDHATACDQFAKSLALVRRGATLLNLGVCETALGKLAAAHAHYAEGIALLAPGDDRLPSATERLGALDRRVVKLRVELGSSAPESAIVRLDGADVPRAKLRELLVDPGEHRLVLILPGRDDAVRTVRVVEGQRETINLSSGQPQDGQQGSETSASAPAAGEPARPLNTAGWVAGGIGLAGVVVAAITGGLIVSNDGTINAQCPDKRCSDEGLKAIDSNKSLFVPNYIGWGVGIAGVAAGAALLIADAVRGSGPTAEASATSASAWIAPLPGGVTLGFETRF